MKEKFPLQRCFFVLDGNCEKPPLCKGRWPGATGPPPNPSASGFGGERRCDGVSETCPASQGRGEGYSVHTDESEGLSATCYGQSQSALRAASSLYTREPIWCAVPQGLHSSFFILRSSFECFPPKRRETAAGSVPDCPAGRTPRRRGAHTPLREYSAAAGHAAGESRP